jgi:soluble lytic murein transglycosylase-like protein
MRAGHPERVIALYERAASDANSYYGMLANRLLGLGAGVAFTEPSLDEASFAALMQSAPARRAVALWQVGRTDDIEAELGRAFGEISPDLDPAFAGLARALDAPSIEMRAAETSTARNVYLSSLYPVPAYEPKGGYDIDQAVLLAFARQESRFIANAQSRSGARGVMQLMPGTAAKLAHDGSLAQGNNARLDDPAYSMMLAQNYIRAILERQNGNLLGLVAAYNAGEGNLSKWMAAQNGNDDPLLFVESIPAPETRDTIKRVLVNMWMYRKRLGEPLDGLDAVAAGTWPIYHEQGVPAPPR